MGYVIGERTIMVRLRNTIFEGAEAHARAANVGDYLLAHRNDAKLIELFIDHLLDWNLENPDGTPVPIRRPDPEPGEEREEVATVAGELDASLLLSLAAGWIRATGEVVRDIPFDQGQLAALAQQIGVAPAQPATNGAAEIL